MSYKNKNNKSSDKNAAATTGRGIDRQPEDQMALSRKNFIYMAVAGVMIVAGFLLMLGPSSTVDHYEPDIFSTRRIVIGPLIAFLGFVAMAIAIIAMPKKSKK